MDKKVGRNDPCPCGSGKKHKQCCWGKEAPKRKLTAKWLNNPVVKEMPNLMERTFKDAFDKGDKPPVPPPREKHLSEELKNKFKNGDPTKDDKSA
jgi:hypothetical protein